MPKGIYSRDHILKDPIKNFWSRVSKSDGCWVWTGSLKVFNGYGGVYVHGRGLVKASRFSWELHNGKIPEGLDICHHCDNPPCVRPDHLFSGTAADNVADMMAKGRHRSGFAAEYERRKKLVSCKLGHPYTSENLYYRKDGSKFCKLCHKARVARYLAHK